MRKKLLPSYILYFSNLDALANTINDIIGLSIQVKAILQPANLLAEISADLLVEKSKQRLESRPVEISHKPTLSPNPPVALLEASLVKPPANQLAEILLERPAKSSH